MKSDREIARSVLERRDAIITARRKRKRLIAQAAAGVAVLSLVAILASRIWQADAQNTQTTAFNTSASNKEVENLTASAESLDSSSPDSGTDSGTPAGNDGDSAAHSADAALPDAQDGTIAAATGGVTPVSYSSLSLPQGEIKPDILLQYSAGSQSMAEILPFSEDMLSKSSAILEGKITDMYLKRYSYDTYDDKFGTKELYHNQCSSIVYELTVDRVWYGDEALAGTSVLIEDDTYLMDSYFSLKIGCSYVIPVIDLDAEKQIWGEYAGGDLTRDGRYATLYPHHPQIEVTLDGDYIVSTDWDTLCPDSARDVELDIPENTLVEYHPENEAGENGLITTEWRTLMISSYDAIYYYDKMKLIEADKFFIQLNQLIDSLH